MLGILGGMGPLATVDFLQKLIHETHSDTDQHHIPTVIWSVPQIPDRSDCIINGSENPFPALRQGALNLQSMGASILAIPCNTAHFWSESISHSTGMPILHIADAVIDYLHNNDKKTTLPIGLMASTGTVLSEIYQKKLAAADIKTITPDDDAQQQVMQGIILAKAGELQRARDIFLEEITQLKRKGAEKIILGCTELPAVLDSHPDFIDSNLALAQRCVRWFNASYNGAYIRSKSDKNTLGYLSKEQATYKQSLR